MAKQTALFLLHLGFLFHAWFFFDTYAKPVSAARAIEERQVDANSTSEAGKKWPANELLLVGRTRDSLKIARPVDALSARGDENEDNSGDDYTHKHLTSTGRNQVNKRPVQAAKRRLRFVKRSESGGNSDFVELGNNDRSLRYHSLRKREASFRDKRTWSISNALSVLTDMVVEHEQRRLADERDAMRRRLLELGKRSEAPVARKNELANRGDRELLSLLQAALSSSETN